MKPTDGGKRKSTYLSLDEKNNLEMQNKNLTSSKVEVIKPGQDVHARQVTVVVQFDGRVPKPAPSGFN